MSAARSVVLSALCVVGAAGIGCGGASPSSDVPPGGQAPASNEPASCGAGTRPRVDSSACEPVGPNTPADGFATRADQWGFEAVTASGCAQGTRRVLGQTECVALDPCTRAFPPAEATITVHGADELAAALATAKDSATIALDRGEYRAVTLDKSVKLVGRCAKEVVFRGTDARGIFVQRELAVALESLAIEGFQAGVVASYGPVVTLKNVVLTDNGLGLVAGEATIRMEGGAISGSGASAKVAPQAVNAHDSGIVELVDVDVRNAGLYAAGPKASLSIRRSLLTRETTAFSSSAFLQAWAGATLDIEDSQIRTAAVTLVDTGRALRLDSGSTVDAAPPRVRIARTEIVQTDRALDAGLIMVKDGTRLEIEDATIDHRAAFAMMVGDPESVLDVTRTVVRTGATGSSGHDGIFVTLGGTATLRDSAIVAARGGAASVAHKGSRLAIERSLIRDTTFAAGQLKAEAFAGAMAIVVADQASLAVDQSAFVANEQVAITAASGGRIDVRGSLFDDTKESNSGDWGNAIIAAEDAQLWLRESVIRGSADAGLSFMKAGGIVEKTRFAGNGVDLAIEDTRYVETAAASDTLQPGSALFFANIFTSGAPTKREGPNVVIVPSL